MSQLQYLVGNESILPQPMEPYAEEICAFAAAFSEALRKHPEAKQYPDVMTAAFWCRKAKIQQKKQQWEKRGEVRLGRGLVFHVTPSNVPINFLFSYLFSLLAGNANLVRVPSKPFPQVSCVCQVLQEVLKYYPAIEARTALIQYPVDPTITEMYSKQADARMIWGGDRTVSTIRSYPTKPKCLDLCFPDRYSICLLEGKAITAADEAALQRLAEGFYQDTYLMDQNACSSPQMIVWKQAEKETKQRFWEAVAKYAKQRYVLQPASCVEKYLKFCQDGIEGSKKRKGSRVENLLYRVEVEELSADGTNLRGSCGYFYEYTIQEEEEFLPLLTEKVQTITYYGINPKELQSWLCQQAVRGVDRIVPIGKALEMETIWDGYEMIELLSRIIEVK